MRLYLYGFNKEVEQKIKEYFLYYDQLDWDGDLTILVETDLDVQGYTSYESKEPDDIEVVIQATNMPKMLLVLAHELIHVSQLIRGSPINEVEAYNREDEVLERFFK